MALNLFMNQSENTIIGIYHLWKIVAWPFEIRNAFK